MSTFTINIGHFKVRLTSKVSKGIIIIAYFALAIVLAEKSPKYRQLFYLTLPMVMVLLCYSSRLVLRASQELKDFYIYITLWIVFTAISFFFGMESLDYVRWFKEFYFIISALISAALIFSVSNKHHLETGLKIFVLCVFLGIVIFDTQKIIYLLKLDIYNLLVNSSSDTESGLSFVAGICILFFFAKKNKTFLFLCSIMLILGSKRIAILAVIFCIVLYYVLKPLYKVFKVNSNIFALVLVSINLLVLLFLVRLAYGDFDMLIQQLLGIPPNFLFMGRVNLFANMLELTEGIPFFPKGLAYTSTVLADGTLSHTNITLKLMHSDLLKYCIELGFPLYAILMFFLYRLASGSLYSTLVVTYYSLLMVTDNITIYFEVMFLIYIVLMLFATDKRKNISKEY